MLTQYEMKWSVLYFMFQASYWKDMRDLSSNSRSMIAFAEEKIALWNELGRVAEVSYSRVCVDYKTNWVPVEHIQS